MGFSLLHAGLAAGAALAALPIILHLFMKQTPKHVIFPALRLIRERQKRSKKKLRVKNWLLLLARAALIALMALALARPALHSEASLGDREVPTALGLVFDTSLSMEYTQRNATRLAEAKGLAAKILEKTPSTSQVFVVDSADPGEPIPMSPSAATKRIADLALQPANRPLNGALGRAYRAVATSDRPRREVYVLTDLARSAWDLGRPAEGLDEAAKIKPGVSTYVLRLTPKEARDVAVVRAEPSAGVVVQGEPVEVRALLRGSGPEQERVAELLLVDELGKRIKKDQKVVNVPADGQVEVVFRVPSPGIGLHQGEVHLTGVDPLPFDDTRYFTFEVQPARRVLVVSDRTLDAEFVVQALDPSELRSSPNRPYRVDRIRAGELNARLLDPSARYACIFLLNVGRLDDPAWSKLNAYVREGGGLIVAPGDRADAGNYNGPVAAQVVPAALGQPTDREEKPVAFGKLDVGHPLFRRYARELPADLSGVPIYRHWGITPSPGSRTLLSYEDGSPALVERAFQGLRTGRVLLWTMPLSRSPDTGSAAAWNDFPLPRFWSFFYLINQTVPYLAGATDAQWNFEAGNDVNLPIDPTRRTATYLVHGPGKAAPTRLTPPAAASTLAIQAPREVGNWTVTTADAGSGPNPAGGLSPGPASATGTASLGFSINPPEAEAEVAALETAQLDTLLGKGKYALADNPDGLQRAVGLARVGRELFPWLMALILALVTAENFLANTFYREQPKG